MNEPLCLLSRYDKLEVVGLSIPAGTIPVDAVRQPDVMLLPQFR